MADKMIYLIETDGSRDTAHPPFSIDCTARTFAGNMCAITTAFSKVPGIKKIKESRTEVHFEVTSAALKNFDALKKQKSSVICGGCRNR
ncbi:MAG: hypothetical protein FWE17_02040 [Alphaproteobacteria bacterium]|nr:hypothetical protein [Alphaproteobacteria bacterium]MCL2758579.1 hypothetical protein [Alphaproteobacteria bacterium]